MRKFLLIGLFGFILSLFSAHVDGLAVMASTDEVSSSSSTKVKVCHIDDDGEVETEEIDESHLNDHLKHGDVEGECPSTPTCFYCDDSVSSQGDGSCICPNGNPGTLISNLDDSDDSNSEFTPTGIRAVQGE